LEKSARILIVEDEPILGLELKDDLVDMGFEVTEIVSDADLVLPAFLRNRPDVVLMDIKLYGFQDGIDSAARIRGFYKTPIVYLSSYSEAEVHERLGKTAPYVYLQKPFDPSILQNSLQSVLNTSG
jgi:DNA-binding response OmpR family regulator